MPAAGQSPDIEPTNARRFWPVQRTRGLAVALLVGFCVAGCTYQGGVENPISRKFTWFSYLAGDDIKSNCRPGEPARYRLVYNAIWDEQVRAYDLRRSATGSGAVLFSHVFGGGGSVASVDLRDPTAPWRGETADKRLDERAYVELVRAIEASGFGAAAPVGLRLPSWAFYWVASACADGRFHFNAWRHPSERFSGIEFSRHLFDHDATGVPVNPPRPIDAAQAGMKPGRPDPTDTTDFELTVGRDGLAGRLTPF
jgi:hypothetical protein